jgi:hypothetical protein
MKARSKQSKAATIRRAEYIVYCLRDCYVCDGWKFDEQAAETFLKNVRRTMDRPSHTKSFYAANDWIVQHGQSLDWVWRGEPGVMICKLASGLVKPNRKAA